MKRLATLLVLLVLLTGCSAGGDEDAAGTTQAATTTETETEATAGTTTEEDEDRATGGDIFGRIPDVVDEVEPSVVAIALDGGEGSGVIWDEDGTIVTNAHVVGDERRVEVVLATGDRVEATVEASDPRTDLAVLQVDRDGLPAAEFRESLPEVGELAIAIGNPLGFENSVTAGIVSGLHRAIPAGGTQPALVDLIQTDAAISPGNSGGALVDVEGRVIGINVAYIPPAERAVSIGFAIPSPTAIDVVRELVATGEVKHAYLGVSAIAITPSLEDAFDLPADEGLVVQEVEPGQPLARAGVETGEVIASFEGRPLRQLEDLFVELRRHDPGEEVTLVVVGENGRRRDVDVTLAERPEE